MKTSLGYQFLADTTLTRRYRHITERKPELDAGTHFLICLGTALAFEVLHLADESHRRLFQLLRQGQTTHQGGTRLGDMLYQPRL